jgi:penicillin-binding protein 1C
VRIAQTELPISQRRFAVNANGLLVASGREPSPQIVYPPEGAHVDLGAKAGDLSPLMLKLQGGRAPFRWLANGKPLPDLSRRRTQSWMPDGGGYSKLTVIDSMGRAASVGVFVD